MAVNRPNIRALGDSSPRALDLSRALQSLTEHFVDDKISISLKYFRRSCECFSEWKKDDLKGLSGVIDKFKERTGAQVRSTTQTCHAHLGDPKRDRFRRPENISEDIKFYEIDVTAKARLHGFFVDPVFFLVWLDRKHECFPV